MRGRKPVMYMPVLRIAGMIKKESPNEGTETRLNLSTIHLIRTHKKRIPE